MIILFFWKSRSSSESRQSGVAFAIKSSIARHLDEYPRGKMHPRSGHWHLIDYIIVHQQDVKDVKQQICLITDF